MITEYPLVRFTEFAFCCEYSYYGPDQVNGGECCRHPDQEERKQIRRKGKKHGCCWMGSCPLLYEADMYCLKNHDPDLYQSYLTDFAEEYQQGVDEKDMVIWDRTGLDWMVIAEIEDRLEQAEKYWRQRLIAGLSKVTKIHPTCRTCPHWNQKTDNRGYCPNPKTRKTVGITVRDYPDRFQDTDECHQFKNDIQDGCEVYFKKDFCCIYHPELVTCQVLPRMIKDAAKTENALRAILDAVKSAETSILSCNSLRLTTEIREAIEHARKVMEEE